jgi:hypothetical protein
MTNEQTIYRIKRLQQQVNSVCCKIKNISIIYQANSNTFPQNLNIGSWLIVTDDGTESGNVLEMWIFNGTTWNEVPTSSFTLPQNVVDALLNSNSPSLTNPYATLLDIPIPNDIIVVINYSALPNPTTVATKFYWVSNSQGTQWLPGSLGGTYYPKGLYYSNGVSWEYMETPYQATQLEVDTGTNNDKFVTPNTLNNSIQWNTKQNTLVSGSNIRTVNGNTLLGSTDLVISGEETILFKSTTTTIITGKTQETSIYSIPLPTDGSDYIIQLYSQAQITTYLGASISHRLRIGTVLAPIDGGVGAKSIGLQTLIGPNAAGSASQISLVRNFRFIGGSSGSIYGITNGANIANDTTVFNSFLTLASANFTTQHYLYVTFNPSNVGAVVNHSMIVVKAIKI